MYYILIEALCDDFLSYVWTCFDVLEELDSIKFQMDTIIAFHSAFGQKKVSSKWNKNICEFVIEFLSKAKFYSSTYVATFCSNHQHLFAESKQPSSFWLLRGWSYRFIFFCSNNLAVRINVS